MASKREQQPKGQEAAEPLLLKTGEVATLLGISPRTVRALCAEGKIPGVVRFGRAVRFRRSAIIEFVEQGCPGCGEDENDRSPA